MVVITPGGRRRRSPRTARQRLRRRTPGKAPTGTVEVTVHGAGGRPGVDRAASARVADPRTASALGHDRHADLHRRPTTRSPSWSRSGPSTTSPPRATRSVVAPDPRSPPPATTASEYLTTQVANTVVTVRRRRLGRRRDRHRHGGGLGRAASRSSSRTSSAGHRLSVGSRITYRISLNRAPLPNVTITVDPRRPSSAWSARATLTVRPRRLALQDRHPRGHRRRRRRGPHSATSASR